jgi:hypothetical protein
LVPISGTNLSYTIFTVPTWPFRALIVLGGAWIARLLRDGPSSDPHSGA